MYLSASEELWKITFGFAYALRKTMKRQNPRGNTATDPATTLREAAAQLEQAETYRQKRNFDRAESICSDLLRKHPAYFGALYTLGLTLADKGDHGRALVYLFRALIRNPRNVMALNALSGVLIELDAKDMASKIVEIALGVAPEDPVSLVTLGELYREDRLYEQAITIFQTAVSLDNNLREAALGLALCLQETGQAKEAAKILEELVRKNASSIDTLFALAQLPKDAVSVDLLQAIGKQVRLPFEDPDEFNNLTLFIKATIFDRSERYQEAWDALLKANREIDRMMQNEYRVVQQQQSQLDIILDKYRAQSIPDSADHPVSLFILGPSRSGKTSLEGLLAALPGVRRGYESKIVERATSAAYQAGGLIDTFSLAYMPQSSRVAFRETYFRELVLSQVASAVITNTNPSNVYDVAALLSIVPNARVVFMKRDVEDVVLRIFMTRYKSRNAYAYNLQSIREHVTWYYSAMEKIVSDNPGRAQIIEYEKMVVDPVGAVTSVANMCGLQVSSNLVLHVHDDSGCAKPYRVLMV